MNLNDITFEVDNVPCDAYDIIIYAKRGTGDLGYLMLCISPKWITIRMIHVWKEYRRQGVATAMLKYLMRNYGDQVITGYVISLPLAKVFIRLGFVSQGTSLSGEAVIYYPSTTT